MGRGARIRWVVGAALFLLGLAACIREDTPDAPSSGATSEPSPLARLERVVYVETEGALGFCGPGLTCRQSVAPRFEFSDGGAQVGETSVCCADCGSGRRSGCRNRVLEFNTSTLPLPSRERLPAHHALPGRVVYSASGGPAPDLDRDFCTSRYRAADLTTVAGRATAESFLTYLTERYGGSVGLDAASDGPRDVCLLVSRAEPERQVGPDGRVGVVSGRISCAEGAAARARNCRFGVVVFEQAFSGNCAMRPLNTIAHEFEHIRQSIRLDLPTRECDQVSGSTVAFEREADAFADSVMPLCDQCR